MAEPADSTVRLGDRERLRVSLASSRGEAETLELWRHICGGFRVCTGLSILMKDGRNAREIEGVLASVPARLESVSFTGSFAGARVFDPDRVDAAMGLLMTSRAVKSVERDVVGGTSAPRLWLLLASAPVDGGLPKPNDGTVQVVQGDTIRLTYSQPSGPPLQFSVVVP